MSGFSFSSSSSSQSSSVFSFGSTPSAFGSSAGFSFRSSAVNPSLTASSTSSPFNLSLNTTSSSSSPFALTSKPSSAPSFGFGLHGSSSSSSSIVSPSFASFGSSAISTGASLGQSLFVASSTAAASTPSLFGAASSASTSTLFGTAAASGSSIFGASGSASSSSPFLGGNSSVTRAASLPFESCAPSFSGTSLSFGASTPSSGPSLLGITSTPAFLGAPSATGSCSSLFDTPSAASPGSAFFGTPASMGSSDSTLFGTPSCCNVVYVLAQWIDALFFGSVFLQISVGSVKFLKTECISLWFQLTHLSHQTEPKNRLRTRIIPPHPHNVSHTLAPLLSLMNPHPLGFLLLASTHSSPFSLWRYSPSLIHAFSDLLPLLSPFRYLL